MKGKASADSAVVFLFKLVDRNHIAAIAGIVKFFTAAADIRHQQAVAPELARSIAKHTDADAAFFGGGVLVLTGDQGSMRIVYILDKDLVDRETDHGVIGGKNKGRRR